MLLFDVKKRKVRIFGYGIGDYFKLMHHWENLDIRICGDGKGDYTLSKLLVVSS